MTDNLTGGPAPSDARQTLIGLIQTYGPDVRSDPRRCEALLRDLCPGEKRDVNLLLTALRERIPDDLLAAPPGQPPAVLVARLAKRLVDTLGLTDDAARWAVGSWALALGLVAEADLPAPAPAPPPYVPPPYVPPAPPPPPRAPLPPDWRRPQPPAPPPIQTARVIRASAVVCLAALGGLALIVHSEHHGSASSNSEAYQPQATPPAFDSTDAPPPDLAGLPVRHWEAAKPVSALALSPDGQTVATGGFKLITLWDAGTGHKLHDIALSPPAHPARDLDAPYNGPQPGEVAQLCFSPDGKHLASTDWGIVTLWNAATGQKEHTPALPTEADTDTVMGTDVEGHWVESTTTKTVPTVNQRVLAFSPDGKQLTADADGSSLVAWDMATGRRRTVIAKMDNALLAFSPDSRTLAGGGSDGVIHLWDAATGQSRRAIRVPSKSAADDPYGQTRYFKDLNAVAFSPDGRTLATSHLGDTNVRLWDAKTGVSGHVLAIGDQYVNAMTFRPDGTFVCLKSDGLTLRDSATGKTLHTYLYQPQKTTSDMFELYPRVYGLSADGQTLAAGGNGNRTFELDGKIVAIWKVTK